MAEAVLGVLPVDPDNGVIMDAWDTPQTAVTIEDIDYSDRLFGDGRSLSDRLPATLSASPHKERLAELGFLFLRADLTLPHDYDPSDSAAAYGVTRLALISSHFSPFTLRVSREEHPEGLVKPKLSIAELGRKASGVDEISELIDSLRPAVAA